MLRRRWWHAIVSLKKAFSSSNAVLGSAVLSVLLTSKQVFVSCMTAKIIEEFKFRVRDSEFESSAVLRQKYFATSLP